MTLGRLKSWASQFASLESDVFFPQKCSSALVFVCVCAPMHGLHQL